MTVPSRVGTDVQDIHEPSQANWNTKLITYTVVAAAKKLVVMVAVHAPNDPITSIFWDVAGVNEEFTLVDQTTSSGSPGDVTEYFWELDNPTVKTADITFNVAAGDINSSEILITSYQDSAAASFINEDVNDGGSVTNVIASGGSAGNLLVAACAWHNNNNAVVGLSAGWASVREVVGTEANSSLLRVAEKEGPSGITFTSQNTNENAGHIIEIVAAAGGGAPLFANHLNKMQGNS